MPMPNERDGQPSTNDRSVGLPIPAEFTSSHGISPSNHMFYGIWTFARKSDPAMKRASVETVTWHTLRHTFASRLVLAGVGLRMVGELMNHSNCQMTSVLESCARTQGISAQ